MRRTSRPFRPLRNVMIATWLLSFLSFIVFLISGDMSSESGWSLASGFIGFIATVLTIIYLPLGSLAREIARSKETRPGREPNQLPGSPTANFELNDAEIGRHGGGSVHIVRAARYYAISFGSEAIAISEMFADRRGAKLWAQNFSQSPGSTPIAHEIAIDSIEKVILGPLTEIVTRDCRFLLDSWSNRRDDSHNRQLLDIVEQLGLVEQVGGLPGTWARTASAELTPAEAQGPSTGRVRPALYRWALPGIFLFATFVYVLSASTTSLLTAVFVALAATALGAAVLLPIGIDVDERQITLTRPLSSPRIPWAQVRKIDVMMVYNWTLKAHRPVLAIEERTGRVRTLRFTQSLRASELGKLLHMLRVHGDDLGLDIPRLTDFGFSPDQELTQISCGGGQSMWDYGAPRAETLQPGRIRS